MLLLNNMTPQIVGQSGVGVKYEAQVALIGPILRARIKLVHNMHIVVNSC